MGEIITTKKNLSSHGYVRVNMENGKREYEHIIVAEQAIGRKLRSFGKGNPQTEVVHHIDGEKTNNASSNLLICTHRYHAELHYRLENSSNWPQFEQRKSIGKMHTASKTAWANPNKRAQRMKSIRQGNMARIGISGFKGVSRHGSNWRARIFINGLGFYVGVFATAREAAYAYDNAAIHHFGSETTTNKSAGLLP